jgi:predicted metallo-beta-lactamase superfamily hydrolase
MRKQAWENGLRLARNVGTLIVDHHLMRSRKGLVWLDGMSQAAGRQVYCAADFMNRPRLLLEAQRAELYQSLPVPENWHEDYEKQRLQSPVP